MNKLAFSIVFTLMLIGCILTLPTNTGQVLLSSDCVTDFTRASDGLTVYVANDGGTTLTITSSIKGAIQR